MRGRVTSSSSKCIDNVQYSDVSSCNTHRYIADIVVKLRCCDGSAEALRAPGHMLWCNPRISRVRGFMPFSYTILRGEKTPLFMQHHRKVCNVLSFILSWQTSHFSVLRETDRNHLSSKLIHSWHKWIYLNSSHYGARHVEWMSDPSCFLEMLL